MSKRNSNFENVVALLREMTGQANTICIPRVLIEFTGDLVVALFLSQCIYWSDKSGNKELRRQSAFYKKAQEWQEEIGLTYRQVSRATKWLVEKGILRTCRKRVKGVPVVHYFVNIETCVSLILTFRENRDSSESESDESQESCITTLTTEITSVVVDEGSDLKNFLAQHQVGEPKLSKILEKGPDLETAKGWFEWAEGRTGLKNPTGYVIERLLAGDPVPPPVEEESVLPVVPVKRVEGPPRSEAEVLWERVEAELTLRRIGSYETFAGVRGLRQQNGTLEVGVPTARRVDWLARRLGKRIDEVAQEEIGVDVVFVTLEGDGEKSAAAPG